MKEGDDKVYCTQHATTQHGMEKGANAVGATTEACIRSAKVYACNGVRNHKVHGM